MVTSNSRGPRSILRHIQSQQCKFLVNFAQNQQVQAVSCCHLLQQFHDNMISLKKNTDQKKPQKTITSITVHQPLFSLPSENPQLVLCFKRFTKQPVLVNDNFNFDSVYHKLLIFNQISWSYVKRHGIVEFNVPLDTLKVISETVLWVTRPDQQCHSTEGRWLVNQVKGQSHQDQLTKR